MKVWRFTTESYPPEQRHQAWRDAMDRLCLPVGDLPEDQHFHGSVSCHVSPLGMEFALVDAAAHEISGKYLEQPNAIWLEDIASSQLRPVELALTEFLITSLGGEKTVFGLGGAAGARASHLHRICQSIETMLGDPALNVNYAAQVHGVSTRYLQKLFTGAGTSFSQDVRSRRLDRCRADLISPLHSQLSISEICFRWGFNGSAHFSRVFRNKYDMSPREYRRGNGQETQTSQGSSA